jgi:hypothetical protein
LSTHPVFWFLLFRLSLANLMSAQSQPLAALELEQELADLLDERTDRLGSHADGIVSRVGLAHAWLQELQQEAAQLKALVKSAPEQKPRLRVLLLDISYCEEIISKYFELCGGWNEELQAWSEASGIER